MTDAPDIVYILGTGSKWADNEIRYSMRSVEKFLPHRRIFIVGERPFFASDQVTHIPAMDPYPSKLKNAVHKIAIAASREDVSERFYLFNDDFFFLKEPPNKLPIYHRGALTVSIGAHPTQTGYYVMAKVNALKKLKLRGIGHPIDYSVHYPMLFTKEGCLEVLSRFGGPGAGYLFRTCYANWFTLGGVELKEVNGRCPMKPFAWRDLSEDAFVSCGDHLSRNQRFRDFLAQRFPNPSKYEV